MPLQTQLFKKAFLKAFIVFQIMALTLPVLGQDVDISIGKKSNWYEQPWAWVVGAAVFILLLVAILRSGKKN